MNVYFEHFIILLFILLVLFILVYVEMGVFWNWHL